jgi:peptidoglycan-associated lipoprotein
MKSKIEATMKSLLILMSVVVLSIVFLGCPKKPAKVPTQEGVSGPAPITSLAEELLTAPEPSIRAEWESIPELKTIYFEFDKAELTKEAKSILKENAKWLKEHPERDILVEGHCCECGTIEYNLGLGQRRAAVVKEFYVNLGIPATRIATISYGEEKPVYPNACIYGDTPLGAKNRRAETKVKKVSK